MKKLKIHCLEHVPYEGPGCIKEWIKKGGHSLTFTRFFLEDELPEITNFDWLIVMGGPMSIHDENEHPWLKKEKHFLKKAISEDKTVIGICLGAQLIADALGARVFPNPEKEIGWFDVFLTKTGKETPIFQRSPAKNLVFHWHGETFDIPEKAIHLFRSEACTNQGFIFNEKVLALQFHFEVTLGDIQKMVYHGASELTGGKTIQKAEEIIAESEAIERNNRLMFQILNNLRD
mgnify:CR=1 FL=1